MHTGDVHHLERSFGKENYFKKTTFTKSHRGVIGFLFPQATFNSCEKNAKTRVLSKVLRRNHRDRKIFRSRFSSYAMLSPDCHVFTGWRRVVFQFLWSRNHNVVTSWNYFYSSHRHQVSRFWRETHAFRPNLTQPRHSDKISLFFFKYYNSRKIF